MWWEEVGGFAWSTSGSRHQSRRIRPDRGAGARDAVPECAVGRGHIKRGLRHARSAGAAANRSHRAAAGTVVLVVAGRLGHGDGGTTTLRIYTAFVLEAAGPRRARGGSPGRSRLRCWGCRSRRTRSGTAWPRSGWPRRGASATPPERAVQDVEVNGLVRSSRRRPAALRVQAPNDVSQANPAVVVIFSDSDASGPR